MSAFLKGVCLCFIFAFSFSVMAGQSVYRTQGYGYLIAVDKGNIKIYDESDHHCLLNQSMTAEYKNKKADNWITYEEGRHYFDIEALHLIPLKKLTALPQNCHQHPSELQSPVATFDSFWWTYAENFPYSQHNNWDWQERYQQWRSLVTPDTSDKTLANIFERIIDRQRDGHSYLVDKDWDAVISVDTRLLSHEVRLRQAWYQDDEYKYFGTYVRAQKHKLRAIIQQEYASGEGLSFFDNFHYLPVKNIGYLRIDDMAGFTKEDSAHSLVSAVNQSMEKLLPKLHQHQALILDLRFNGGGTDIVSLELLSHLYAKTSKIGSKASVHKGNLGPKLDIVVTPKKQSPYIKPIVVLTSNETASAAEIMLMGLTARPHTQLIGENSNGSFSDILPKQLSNGWYLGLSHQIYFDIQDVDREEVGFPVKHHIPFLDVYPINLKKPEFSLR